MRIHVARNFIPPTLRAIEKKVVRHVRLVSYQCARTQRHDYPVHHDLITLFILITLIIVITEIILNISVSAGNMFVENLPPSQPPAHSLRCPPLPSLCLSCHPACPPSHLACPTCHPPYPLCNQAHSLCLHALQVVHFVIQLVHFVHLVIQLLLQETVISVGVGGQNSGCLDWIDWLMESS